jgi:hypothetical protein
VVVGYRYSCVGYDALYRAHLTLQLGHEEFLGVPLTGLRRGLLDSPVPHNEHTRVIVIGGRRSVAH